MHTEPCLAFPRTAQSNSNKNIMQANLVFLQTTPHSHICQTAMNVFGWLYLRSLFSLQVLCKWVAGKGSVSQSLCWAQPLVHIPHIIYRQTNQIRLARKMTGEPAQCANGIGTYAIDIESWKNASLSCFLINMLPEEGSKNVHLHFI